MKERMSIANRCFLGMRSAFDQALEGTVQRMLDMHAGECSVAIKLNIELMGVDAADRIVPHIKYKISTSIPMKGDFQAILKDPILLEEDADGLMVVQEGEQMSMLD